MLLKKRENISTEAQPAGSKHRSDEAARRKQSQISREPTISSSDLTPRERERERKRERNKGREEVQAQAGLLPSAAAAALAAGAAPAVASAARHPPPKELMEWNEARQ
jgi:hypothetical protein